MNSVYFVINPDFWPTPRIAHRTIESAKREAMRLAASTPGIRYSIMGEIEAVKHTPPPQRRVEP